MKSERMYKWDNLKFILIFLVVLGHFMEGFLDDSELFKATWLYIYSFHMPVFIFISGLFSKGAVNDPVKCKQKMFSFVKMYIYFKIAICAGELLVRGETRFSVFSESSAPWYLLAMAMFIGITALIKNKDPKRVMFAAILFALAQGYDREINEFMTLGRVFAFYPCFYAGYLLKPSEIINKLRANKWISNVFVKMIAGLSLIAAYEYTVFNIDYLYEFRPLFTGKNSFFTLDLPKYGWLCRLGNYVWAAYVCFVLILVVPNVKMIISKWGARTLSVYILHSVLYRTMRAAGFEEELRRALPNRWMLFVLVFSVFITVFFSYEKFNTLLVNIMSNNWSKKEKKVTNSKKLAIPLVKTKEIS